jgi:amino acid adenylation domain-containing protein
VSASFVHELLTRSAQNHGARPAVIDRDQVLSYAELDESSNRLAHALISAGTRPGDRVGLFLEKSLEAVIAIYGVLKTGAVYVPFDDQAPLERLAYIARDAEIRVVVSSADKARGWNELRAAGAPIHTIVAAGEGRAAAAEAAVVPWSALSGYSSSAPIVATSEDALAYILYTSGSTGMPKGVMLSHRNALAFVEWAAGEIGVAPADRLSSHAPFHFDLSTFDLFAAACGGAAVVLVPRAKSVFPVELSHFISESGITVWYSVPSILTLLTLRGGLDTVPLSQLRAVLFAGEVFPTKHLSRLMSLLPRARFVNLYGPTETNVCTWYDVPRTRGELPDPIPIGVPIPGVEVRIEDGAGRLVRSGDWGELVVEGPTVMHGYWGDPERTARALRVSSAGRAYLTGDIVRMRPDDTIEFGGRRDAQVKTRGYRVELGEIEVVLNAHEDVIECAVVAIPDEVSTNRLKAFVAVQRDCQEAELSHWCQARLPRYMVPDEFELRDELPKSSTGKIDRRRLAAA